MTVIERAFHQPPPSSAGLAEAKTYVPGARILHPFRPQSFPTGTQPLPEVDQRLAISLLRDGLLAPHSLLLALTRLAERPNGRLIEVLCDGQLVGEGPLYDVLQRQTGMGQADLSATADPRLVDRLGASFCLSERLLPLRSLGTATIIAAADPASFARHGRRLSEVFGQVLPTLAPASGIEQAILASHGPAMARSAEDMVAVDQSCRTFRKASRTTLHLLLAAAVICVLVLRPILLVLTCWAALSLAFSTALKLAACVASLRKPEAEAPNPAHLARLPVVSIMVALYRESDIAARLVKRLGRLDYPRDLLDIVLVVEQEDHMTRQALLQTSLPSWMRVVVTPAGRVKTKPRALNHGLTQCRGSIIGVYDAEDAPDPDQIRKVVARFAQRGPKVACLQGALDFYNPSKNWLARCFTIEYAAWFRVVLPGLQRLGIALPLGGTTLFFRRAVLESLGGWDAYNVTEDADLGIRLARHGYRTEILPSTTLEEANCNGLAWVKQRSRWIKGYMMTYLTHMRDPVRLWRDLGPRAFLGFQILFLGSLSQALLAPVLWSLWFFCLGLGHPLVGLIHPATLTHLTWFFLGCEAVNVATGLLGLKRSGQKLSPLWVPTLMLYFPLQAFAAYKAAWEMLHKPFYWDKTTHGTFH